MNTLLNTERQALYLANNNDYSFTHKWSRRGMGNSKLIMGSHGLGEPVAKASDCSYDRFGTVLSEFTEHLFMPELKKLARRFAKTKQTGQRKASAEFYGLFVRKDGTVYLDGACGSTCIEKVLNAIGFELRSIASTGYKEQTGTEFYNLKPISKHARKYRIKPIK